MWFWKGSSVDVAEWLNVNILDTLLTVKEEKMKGGESERRVRT